MDPLAQVEPSEGQKTTSQQKNTNDNKDGGSQIISGVVSSMQVESTGKRPFVEEQQEAKVADNDATKWKKMKEDEDKEPMGKPALVARGPTGRIFVGTKLPGPASMTGAIPLGKSATPLNSNNGVAGSSGMGNNSQGGSGWPGAKSNASTAHQGKSGGIKAGSNPQLGKQDAKCTVVSPKPSQAKYGDNDGKDQKNQGSSSLKVPPLKIVIPGGASGSGGRNEQDGEGSTGPRGSTKGRGNSFTLPYVIPSTSTGFGHASTSFDYNYNENPMAGQRVLRSHRANVGEKEMEKERRTPQRGTEIRSGKRQSRSLSYNKSPHRSGSGKDSEYSLRTSSSSRLETATAEHSRKRKMKTSKESHSRAPSKIAATATATSTSGHKITHPNPYELHIQIRDQITSRQKSLLPVKPKPPKDFNKYLMNRRTYTLQRNVNMEPRVEVPHDLPPAMLEEYLAQEKERTHLRIQHLVEKEKLVLAVEQEIVRVHGRAERAVANQVLPYSVCTILRDANVYNLMPPEQEKRNAQRSRCNGRQINSWLQEVDDKWEKIKEGMLRRQHTEAQTLHAVQAMEWNWQQSEVGIIKEKSPPGTTVRHVPHVHVANFDLPA